MKLLTRLRCLIGIHRWSEQFKMATYGDSGRWPGIEGWLPIRACSDCGKIEWDD